MENNKRSLELESGETFWVYPPDKDGDVQLSIDGWFKRYLKPKEALELAHLLIQAAEKSEGE